MSDDNEGIRAWAKGDLAAEAVAEIIIGTHLAEYVIPAYLDWDESHQFARPNLHELVQDIDTGKHHSSSSADFLARLCLSLMSSEASVSMGRLWSLDRGNRQVVVSALASALGVEALS